ncbi:ABC transporter permease [Micromonospora sp. NBC_01699]|uniref:ABC transporter permease n=1 Tax=Micromonospora sp. NBC_01699 TaxID=2975984 RepID=UPI002E332837|nr:ABC transporter permease [Micromonospora sp. NBC_01699]
MVTRLGRGFGWLVLAIMLVAAVAPGLFTDLPATEPDLASALRPPDGTHWFGTDELGRDVFSRVVHGAGYSLLVGGGAVLLATTAATVIGLLAAFGGNPVDRTVVGALDLLLALPGLLLSLLVITVTGAGTVNVLIAVALGSLPGFARVIRAQALLVRRSEYVEAARCLGIRRRAILWRHVVPNTLAPLLVLGTTGVGTCVVAGAALSFLGLGAQAPAPEWGTMISDGRHLLDQAWWVAVFPGLAISLTVILMTVLGRDLERHFGAGTT